MELRRPAYSTAAQTVPGNRESVELAIEREESRLSLRLNQSQLPFQPEFLIGESSLGFEFQQALIASHHVEANTPLQLSQVYGTEMKRASIGFGQVVRTVHDAAIPNTVLYA